MQAAPIREDETKKNWAQGGVDLADKKKLAPGEGESGVGGRE